jgi:1,2-diacylglycerol 3-beta-galactosyltransferase
LDSDCTGLKDKKKNVLILTADSGFGHRSAANAIAAAMEQQHPGECEITIINPLEDRRAPIFLRDSAADYDRLIRNAPDLYRFGYNASDNEVPNFIIESLLTVSLYEVMRDMVRDLNPDAIVTTYPMYQAPLNSYFTINRYRVPLITVVTDLVTVHRMWFSPSVELCLVPTTEVQELALINGMAANKIHITGIPVSPAYATNRKSKAEIRKELGWDPHLPTFLAVGSRRADRLLETLNVLNHFGKPVQVIALAGKDEALYDQLKAVDWHIPAHVFGLVNTMPDFMLASDAVICKAGGLIVTESLACGMPLLLIDVIPGQEEGNRDFVLKYGAGVMVENPMQTIETLSHWLADDGRVLKEYAKSACSVGRSNSAFDAADLIWQAAQRGPRNSRGKPGTRRTSLIDLLTRNNIPLGDTQKRKAKELS